MPSLFSSSFPTCFGLLKLLLYFVIINPVHSEMHTRTGCSLPANAWSSLLRLSPDSIFFYFKKKESWMNLRMHRTMKYFPHFRDFLSWNLGLVPQNKYCREDNFKFVLNIFCSSLIPSWPISVRIASTRFLCAGLRIATKIAWEAFRTRTHLRSSKTAPHSLHNSNTGKKNRAILRFF